MSAAPARRGRGSSHERVPSAKCSGSAVERARFGATLTALGSRSTAASRNVLLACDPVDYPEQQRAYLGSIIGAFRQSYRQRPSGRDGQNGGSCQRGTTYLHGDVLPAQPGWQLANWPKIASVCKPGWPTASRASWQSGRVTVEDTGWSRPIW